MLHLSAYCGSTSVRGPRVQQDTTSSLHTTVCISRHQVLLPTWSHVNARGSVLPGVDERSWEKDEEEGMNLVQISWKQLVRQFTSSWKPSARGRTARVVGTEWWNRGMSSEDTHSFLTHLVVRFEDAFTHNALINQGSGKEMRRV
uniref:Secreted protein n=1 Tax=Mesocestoides corti TaxID=53468 RepID=A0A5K3FNY2_MESCO